MSQLPTQYIYSLEKLQQVWQEGKRFKFAYFWNSTDEDAQQENYNSSCCNQWFPCDFVDKNGIKYNCCEQYMMAQKATLFKDNEVLEKILSNNDPREIKKLGREVKNFDKEIWGQNCQEIVFQGNLYKFSQNEKCKNYLLSVTNDTIFVEASPFDAIWGIKLSEKKASKKTPLEWQGTNFLGFQITRVRDYLISNATQ